MPLLDVSGLAKRFGATVVLDGVGFALAEGECIALLGPSGCGKTTTLRCIAGLEQPDDGRIVLGGGGGRKEAEEHRQRDRPDQHDPSTGRGRGGGTRHGHGCTYRHDVRSLKGDRRSGGGRWYRRLPHQPRHPPAGTAGRGGISRRGGR